MTILLFLLRAVARFIEDVLCVLAAVVVFVHVIIRAEWSGRLRDRWFAWYDRLNERDRTP